MNQPRHFGLRLTILAILVGTGVLICYVAGITYPNNNDFDLAHLALLDLLFCSLTFAALWSVVFLCQIKRHHLRNCLQWLRTRLFTRRSFQRLLAMVACLILLLCLFYLEEDWRGNRAWDHFQKTWTAQGEHFDFAHFVPPPVPDAQNFALTPIVASAYNGVMDNAGRKLKPGRTNLVNHMQMGLMRHYAGHAQEVSMNPAMVTNRWQNGGVMDLQAWQYYFRAQNTTNVSGEFYQSLVATPVQDPGRGSEMADTQESEPLATNEFPVAPVPQSPAADVLLALSKFKPTIAALRVAARLPDSRFPLDYDDADPFTIILPHLAPLKSCVQVLQLRACAELAEGQSDQALTDIKLALRLVESLHSEPFWISLNTRKSMVNQVLQPVWEGQVHHQWTDPELSDLAGELARLDFLTDICQIERADCATRLQTIENCRLNHNGLVVPGFGNEVPDDIDFQTRLQLVYYHSFPDGWYALGKLAYARITETAILPAIDLTQRLVNPTNYSRLAMAANYALNQRAPWSIYLRSLFPFHPLDQIARVQTSVDCARIACALEHYRQVHGNYPESLDAVASYFPDPLPHDVINGQPLHYRRTASDKFLLYSIGWNNRDDGGLPPDDRNFENYFSHDKGGDWVWLFPSS